MSDAREVIPLAEAAERLGVSVTTARRLARNGNFPGQLPKIPTLKTWFVSVRGLDEYINSYRGEGEPCQT
jgi:hypothetical protein